MRDVLVDVETPLASDGHLMPVLVLNDVYVVPTKMGYDGRRRDLIARPGGDSFSFSVARMFSFTRRRRGPGR